MARLTVRSSQIPFPGLIPVLTGAGASFSLGFPMMDTATVRFGQYLAEIDPGPSPLVSRRGLLKHYKKRLDEELRNLGARTDLETFWISLETHISYVERAQAHGLARLVLGERREMSLVSNGGPPHLEALHNLRFALMEFIHREYGKPLTDEARSLAAAVFQRLAKTLQPRGFALYTTNYDTVAEAVPAMLGMHRLDGFRASAPERPEVWSAEGFIDYDEESHDLPVMHLHGAASWISTDSEVRRYPGLGALRSEQESILVYPGQGKDDVALEMPDPSRLSYDYLGQAIARHHLLVAIGYSFRDPAILRLVDRAAAFAQRSVTVAVVAPDASEIVAEFFGPSAVRGIPINARYEDHDEWSHDLKRVVERNS